MTRIDSSTMCHPLQQFKYCPRCGSNLFINNDIKSRRCTSCGFVYYFNPAAATVAIIIDNNQQLLVCRRAKEPARGTLDLPGGFCDCFETAEQAVAREVKEETGLDVYQTEYLFSLPNTYLYSDFLVHTVDIFFHCHVTNIHQAHAADDAAELIWCPINQLKPELFGLNSIRQGIKQLINTLSNNK